MTDAKQSIAEEAGIPLPRYISHKKVYALKIEQAIPLEGGGRKLVFVDGRYAPRHVSAEYTARIKAGDDAGYYVVYDDGYESWSPTKAFEEGYSTWPPMDCEQESAS